MIEIPVSCGDLLDKYSILLVKEARIKDKIKRQNVQKEMYLLQEQALDALHEQSIWELFIALYAANSTLWIIEDKIRACEKEKDFGHEFIKLARQVYHTNDKRAELKRQINVLSGSELIEEKSYEAY